MKTKSRIPMRKPEIKNRNMKIGCRHEVMKAAVASFVVSAGLLCGAAEVRRPARGAVDGYRGDNPRPISRGRYRGDSPRPVAGRT